MVVTLRQAEARRRPSVHRVIFMNALQGYSLIHEMHSALPKAFTTMGNMVGSYHFIQIVVGRNILAYFIT